MIVRILGTFDNYNENSKINLENFEIIQNWKNELIFHKSLQKNQKILMNTRLKSLMQSINNENNINYFTKYSNHSKDLILNNFDKNGDFSKSKYENNKNYQLKKKDFANRILAFLKKYKLSDEISQENNYIILKINSLISNQHFSIMMGDFCRDNIILDPLKFLKEVFSLIEENSMGKFLEEESEIEIKMDERIDNDILKMLKGKPEGMYYMDIFDKISKNYNNFFMNDYIKYIIEDLMQNGKIHAIQQNFYQIMS